MSTFRELSRSTQSLAPKPGQPYIGNISLSLDHLAGHFNRNTGKIYDTLDRVRKKNSDINGYMHTFNECEKTWMLKAAQNNETAMLAMLTKNPGLANHKDFISGYSALHWMAKHGNAKMAEVLIKHYNANINEKTHGGSTPLHLCRQYGNQDLFDLLLEKFDADFRIRDNYGKKPHQYHLVMPESNVGKRPRFSKAKMIMFSSYNHSKTTTL